MRVLMLSKACLVGIYQRKLEEIAAYPDIELKVLVPPSWKDERGELVLERVYTTGYDLQVTPIRFNGYFHWHYYPEFRREARTFQPDIIHIDEEPYNLATWFALRTAKRIGAKCLFFSWQNIQRTYPFPFRLGEAWVLWNVDYALMGTQSAADVWRAKGYQGRLKVVPQFGVDTALFKPCEDEKPPGEVLKIGYVGRLVYEKGVDVLLNALASLVEMNWSLTLVGGGPEESRLRTQIEHLGLQNRVNFEGQMPSVQIPTVYENLDILVIPSRTLDNWKEQFGRVIIEAMSSGVCVIGSNSGAIPDVIGEAGLIFPEDDAAALAENLTRLMRDSVLRKTLSGAGRQRVLAYFTQHQVAAQTVAVYREML